MKKIKRFVLGLFTTLCMFLPLRSQIVWELVEPGVWKGVVGIPEKYSLLGVAGVTPNKEGFSRLPDVELPSLAHEIVGTLQDGKTALRIPLDRKEQLYGFGLNFQTVHQRGNLSFCRSYTDGCGSPLQPAVWWRHAASTLGTWIYIAYP